LGYEGLHQMIKRVARRAGVAGVYAHRFRHTAAHTQRKAGMSEGDMMLVFGWKSRAMADRYGASAAHERALETARRLSHADRI
jgi:integrase